MPMNGFKELTQAEKLAHFRGLEQMYLAAPINRFFNPIISISEGSAEVGIPIRIEFHHAAFATHGSVYFKAMDDAGFFAASSFETEYFLLTVSFTVYFLRPIVKGEMRAFGRVVHHSQRQYISEVILTDADGAEIGRGSGMFVPSHIPLSLEMGYSRIP